MNITTMMCSILLILLGYTQIFRAEVASEVWISSGQIRNADLARSIGLDRREADFELPLPGARKILVVDSFPGADIGTKIANAVDSCRRQEGSACTLEVTKKGIIRRCPEIPEGYTLIFYAPGDYPLFCHFVINHRATQFFFNGARFIYMLNDGSSAFYIGKGLTGTVRTIGKKSVFRGSGPSLLGIDPGDQIAIDSGKFQPYGGNVERVTSAAHLISAEAIPARDSARYAVEMYAYPTIYGGRGVSIHDLAVVDGRGTADSTALTVELASVDIEGFESQNFASGTCLKILGSIAGNYYHVHCNIDRNGIILSPNSIGHFFISSANANRFFGIDITSGTGPDGHGILIAGSSQNQFYGLHEESLDCHLVNLIQQAFALGYSSTSIQSEENYFLISDDERNGDNRAGSADFVLLDGTDHTGIEGGTFASIYTGKGDGLGTQYGLIATAATRNTHLGDTKFSGSYVAAYEFISGATGEVTNVSSLGVNVSPPLVIDSSGDIRAGSVRLGGGSTKVYRCVEAGRLPVGALTSESGNCKASVDTGLRTK